jgi:DnaK suppressor protein
MNTTRSKHAEGVLREMLREILPRQATRPTMERHPDFFDEATAREEATLIAGDRDRDAARIIAIEDALTAIALGEYGTCSECGEQIPDARLDAIPWTRECLTCATKLEKARAEVAECKTKRTEAHSRDEISSNQPAIFYGNGFREFYQ